MCVIRFFFTICLAIQILHAYGIFAAPADGGRADAFYNFGAGARSLGMGKAYSAVADTVEAMYWNPAGLMQVEKMELSTLSSDLFMGYKFTYHGLVYPMPDQVFAFHSAGLTSPLFEGRDSQNNLTSSFSDSKTSLGASFATKLSPQMSFGVSYKKFTRVLASYADEVTLIDGGILLQPSEQLRIGLTAMNLVSMVDASKTSDKFEINLRLGLAYQASDAFLLSLDMGDGLSHWFAGAEFHLHPALALRGGVNYDEFTWGVGLNLDPFYADYSDGSMELGHSTRFSMRFKIGGSTKEQK
jgi:long-subunit fatty acid transport protein